MHHKVGNMSNKLLPFHLSQGGRYCAYTIKFGWLSFSLHLRLLVLPCNCSLNSIGDILSASPSSWNWVMRQFTYLENLFSPLCA